MAKGWVVSWFGNMVMISCLLAGVAGCHDYAWQHQFEDMSALEAAQQQAAQNPDSPEAKLAQLDSMLKKGYITQAEYDAKKKEILASM